MSGKTTTSTAGKSPDTPIVVGTCQTLDSHDPQQSAWPAASVETHVPRRPQLLEPGQRGRIHNVAKNRRKYEWCDNALLPFGRPLNWKHRRRGRAALRQRVMTHETEPSWEESPIKSTANENDNETRSLPGRSSSRYGSLLPGAIPDVLQIWQLPTAERTTTGSRPLLSRYDITMLQRYLSTLPPAQVQQSAAGTDKLPGSIGSGSGVPTIVHKRHRKVPLQQTRIVTPRLLSRDRLEYHRPEPHWLLQIAYSMAAQLHYVFMQYRNSWTGLIALVVMVLVPATVLFWPVLVLLGILHKIALVVSTSVPGTEQGRKQIQWLHDYLHACWFEFVDGTDRLRGMLVTGVLLLYQRQQRAYLQAQAAAVRGQYVHGAPASLGMAALPTHGDHVGGETMHVG